MQIEIGLANKAQNLPWHS